MSYVICIHTKRKNFKHKRPYKVVEDSAIAITLLNTLKDLLDKEYFVQSVKDITIEEY